MTQKIKDLTGQKFGSLEVIRMERRVVGKKKKFILYYAICVCEDCKSELPMVPSNLKIRRQDGCRMCRKIKRTPISSPVCDLTGKKFGFLEVTGMRRNEKSRKGEFYAVCKCLNCGKNNYEANPTCIRRTENASCGCYKGFAEKYRGKLSAVFTGYEDIRSILESS